MQDHGPTQKRAEELHKIIHYQNIDNNLFRMEVALDGHVRNEWSELSLFSVSTLVLSVSTDDV